MTSKTSSIKRNQAAKLLGATLRKNIGPLILLTVAMLLLCPGFMLKSLQETETAYLASQIRDMDESIIMINTVAGCIAVLLFNFINFGFLYTKRAGDVFFALPISRASLLFSRALAGFILAAVPVLVSYGAMTVVHLSYGYLVLSGIRTLWCGALLTAVCMLICSAFSLVFLTVAGSTFDLLVSFAAFNIGGVLLVLMYDSLCQDLLTGYLFGDITEAMTYISPAVLCGSAVNDFLYKGSVASLTSVSVRLWVLMAVWFVLSVVLAVVLFRRRPTEASGGTYAFRFMPLLCGVVVAQIGAFAVGMIFSDGEIDFIFWLFAVIGALLLAVTFGAVTNRGFKMLKRSFLIGGIAVVIMGAVGLMLKFGGLGYTAKIPEIKNIASVEMTFSGNNDCPASAELATEVHREVLQTVKKPIDEQDELMMVQFHYKLKNGSTLNREFLVPRSEKTDRKLLAVTCSKERIESLQRQVDAMEKDAYVTFWQNFNATEERTALSETNIQITRSEARQIMAAYLKDLPKATEKIVFSENGVDGYTMEWWNEDSVMRHDYQSIELRVEPQFTETKAVLTALQLEERALKQREEVAEDVIEY